MTFLEWFKYEARRIETIDGKIAFASDMVIHCNWGQGYRLARRYHGILCHIDEIKERRSKDLALKNKKQINKNGKNKKRDSVVASTKISTEKSLGENKSNEMDGGE